MNKLEKYILEHIDSEDDVLEELNRETHLKVLGTRMLSGHLQGQVLTMLSKMIQPDNILEIGTFTGYSAICLAKGLRVNGKLVTIEIDDEFESIARKYFAKSEFGPVITLLIGSAQKIIPSLKIIFDLVFIDGNKREYLIYYNLVFDKLKRGGFIIVDNTLWNGKIIDNTCSNDSQTAGIMEFNSYIKNDNRVEKVILNIRDGITIIRKK
ncbi:MAG: O-methyltransferase [Bacteroidales bacterium]|jgi:predicted O-methyltransferase YrrM|nr:O-methyltransferase [Bacteroidales bacterium]